MRRILIADDQPMMRGLIRGLLARIPVASVVEAGNAAELRELAAKKPYDLIILELCLGGALCLGLLHELRARWPNAAVLVFTCRAEDELGVRCLRLGAAGYLCKGTASQAELVQAIRTVLSGGVYASTALQAKVISFFQANGQKSGIGKLSDREYEVMDLMVSGHSLTGIAALLSISPNSVETYRRRIFKKLGLTTYADLIRYHDQNIRPEVPASVHCKQRYANSAPYPPQFPARELTSPSPSWKSAWLGNA